MFKKILFGIAFIAIVAIATINTGISSKKNFLLDFKNANIEALANTEGGLDFVRICEDSERCGPLYDAWYGINCDICDNAFYIRNYRFYGCVY